MWDKKEIDANKIKGIHEWLKNNTKYNKYYCEPSSLSNARRMLNHNHALNCSDIDLVDEQVNEYKKEFFKKHILRKATPEELEWIEKQPKVDLDSPEHEHLKPILKKLVEEGWFD